MADSFRMAPLRTPAQALARLRRDDEDDVAETVRAIIRDVRRNGDSALRRLSRRFDRVALKNIRQPLHRARVDAQFVRDAKLAYARILRYHEIFADKSGRVRDGGGIWGRVVRPIRRVGIYVPAGSAPLFSTLLMAAAAARAAGVPELVIASPPPVSDTILAAAAVAGIREIYALGGAQAIAALAFGTKSVRPVDKIVGPGNKFVAEAKRQVYGKVGIDCIAGPTELLILADDTADPDVLAADMLAQAEHDVDASALLATTSRALAGRVQSRLSARLIDLPRRRIAERSLKRQGSIVICRTRGEMISFANAVAAEHLEIIVKNPWPIADRITAAGAIFVGPDAPEALGDYIAGPNHILPTGRTARFSGPLSARDFVSVSSLQWFPASTRRSLSAAAARMARAEQLEGHARSIEARSTGKKMGNS